MPRADPEPIERGRTPRRRELRADRDAGGPSIDVEPPETLKENRQERGDAEPEEEAGIERLRAVPPVALVREPSFLRDQLGDRPEVLTTELALVRDERRVRRPGRGDRPDLAIVVGARVVPRVAVGQGANPPRGREVLPRDAPDDLPRGRRIHEPCTHCAERVRSQFRDRRSRPERVVEVPRVDPPIAGADRVGDARGGVTEALGPRVLGAVRQELRRGAERFVPEDLDIDRMVAAVGRVPDRRVGGVDPVANARERSRRRADRFRLAAVPHESGVGVGARAAPGDHPGDGGSPGRDEIGPARVPDESADEVGVVEGRVGSPVEEERPRGHLHREFPRLPSEDRHFRMRLETKHARDGALGPLPVPEPDDGREHPGKVATPEGRVPRVPRHEADEPVARRAIQAVKCRPCEPIPLFEVRGVREHHLGHGRSPRRLRLDRVPGKRVRIQTRETRLLRSVRVPLETSGEEEADFRRRSHRDLDLVVRAELVDPPFVVTTVPRAPVDEELAREDRRAVAKREAVLADPQFLGALLEMEGGRKDTLHEHRQEVGREPTQHSHARGRSLRLDETKASERPGRVLDGDHLLEEIDPAEPMPTRPAPFRCC